MAIGDILLDIVKNLPLGVRCRSMQLHLDRVCELKKDPRFCEHHNPDTPDTTYGVVGRFNDIEIICVHEIAGLPINTVRMWCKRKSTYIDASLSPSNLSNDAPPANTAPTTFSVDGRLRNIGGVHHVAVNLPCIQAAAQVVSAAAGSCHWYDLHIIENLEPITD